MTSGLVYAFIAFLAWGFGDFLLQRSTRKFGVVFSLFLITAFGSVALLPFALKDAVGVIQTHNYQSMWLLFGTTVAILLAGVLELQALRVGKISVIEPVYAFEVIATTILSIMLLQEIPSLAQGVLILTVCVGIFLVSIQQWKEIRSARLEAGVWIALIATTIMGGVNFLFGVAGRATSPMLVNWVTSVGLAVPMAVIIFQRQNWSKLWIAVRQAKALVLGVVIIDTIAWVAFTYSTLTIPVSIATGISESYIALAVVLGILWNHERLRRHQVIGVCMTIMAAVALAFSLA